MVILKKPIITEKMNQIGEKLFQYGFVVDKRANKNEIKAEIEKVYDVEVTRVNTLIQRGKRKIRQTKSGVVQSKGGNFKKAIVTLKEGQTIDFYESI